MAKRPSPYPHSDDVVGTWTVPMRGKAHVVVFEHGALLTGKRVVVVDDVVVVRKDSMMKLVGDEPFRIGSTPCRISIDTKGSWDFRYSLHVDGKLLTSFIKDNQKKTRTWLPVIKGKERRVVLELHDVGVYVDGKKVETTGEFLESDDENTVGQVSGSAHNFLIDDSTSAQIKIYSSGDRFEGLKYDLYISEKKIPAATLEEVLSSSG